MKIFNLEKNYNFTNNLQANLDIIYNLFGNKFIIEGKYSLPVIITKSELVTSELIHYVITYDINNPIDDTILFNYLTPLRIRFYDPIDIELNNNVYIDNISRTEKISGSEMTKFILSILKKLGTKKAYLNDGAQVQCSDGTELDLSMYKLLEKSQTFYTALGFKFVIHPNTSRYLMLHFKNEKLLYKILKKTLEIIRRITIKSLIDECLSIISICTKSIQNNDENNIIIKRIRHAFVTPVEPYILESSLVQLYEDSYNIIKLLRNSDKEFFCDFLIDLVKQNRCNEYKHLIYYILDRNIYTIKYDDIQIKRKYILSFFLLDAIRDSSIFVYDFEI